MKSESVSPKCIYNKAMQNIYLHPTKSYSPLKYTGMS